MILVQKKANGSLVEVPFGSTITTPDVRYPWQIAELWSDADLNAIGLYRAVLAAVPAGKVMTGYSFTQSGNVVTQVPVLADAAPFTKLAKRTIFDRATLNEAEAFRAFLDDANAKDWGHYDSASYLDTSDPMFATLVAGMVAALKSVMDMTDAAALERVNEILKPES